MFNFLNIKTNTLGKSAFILAFFTLGAQILAVVRDKIFSIKFGAGIDLDIYQAAFKIPHIVFLLTGTLISAFILIPIFEKKEKKGKEFLQDFIDKVFYTFIIFMILVSALVFLLMPQVASTFFSGFSPSELERFIEMSRVLLLSPIFIGLSTLFVGINQKNGYFIPTAIVGLVYNLSIILSTIFLYPVFGFTGILVGVIVGSILHLLIQIPTIITEGLLPKKIKFFTLKESFSILKLAAPRSAALILIDVLLVILIAKASSFSSGSIVILVFALNIYMVPVRLIAVSYSSASFPKMSKFFENKDWEFLQEITRKVISKVLFFGIPIAFYFLFFSKSIIGFLLGSEKFAWQEINTTAFLVSILSPIIMIQAIYLIILKVFYAMEKTRISLVINSLILISFFVFYYIFKNYISSDIINNFIEREEYTEGIYDLFILVISYISSILLGIISTIILFKKNTINFLLFFNTGWKNKIIISFISISIVKIIHLWSMSYIGIIENSIFYFSTSLLSSSILYLLFMIFFLEIYKGRDYLEFKGRVLNRFLKNKK